MQTGTYSYSFFFFVFGRPRVFPSVMQEIQQAMMDYQSNSNGFENAAKWHSEIGLPMTRADRRR